MKRLLRTPVGRVLDGMAGFMLMCSYDLIALLEEQLDEVLAIWAEMDRDS